MKKTYVPVTLNEYINESKSITLKRKYGERQPVVVGANAPLRNQVLAFVSESSKVSRGKLKKFIAGLNETSKNPVAAANMWLKRNDKFFITESKNGITYYKLSTIGKRLANRLIPSGSTNLSESEEKSIRQRILNMSPSRKKLNESEWDLFANAYEFEINGETYYALAFNTGMDNTPQSKQHLYTFDSNGNVVDNFNEEIIENNKDNIINISIDDIPGENVENILQHPIRESNENYEDEFEEETRPGSYDFVDREKGYERPGIYDEMDEEDMEENIETMDESTKERIKKIIENIKSKRKKSEELNEAEDDEKEDSKDDELTFDDLDLEAPKEAEDETGEEDEEAEDETGEEDETEEDETEEDETDEKVEITEFIITVDDVDEAISELTELDVEAEKVVDEEGEEIEDQIKVSADDWESLKGWLEDKGVDIEEMFGGEIEVEDELPEEDEDDSEELEFSGKEDDLEGEEFDLESENEDEEIDLDLSDEEEMEESVTGMEGPEGKKGEEKWPNQPGGKGVTINITGS